MPGAQKKPALRRVENAFQRRRSRSNKSGQSVILCGMSPSSIEPIRLTCMGRVTLQEFRLTDLHTVSTTARHGS